MASSLVIIHDHAPVLACSMLGFLYLMVGYVASITPECNIHIKDEEKRTWLHNITSEH